LGRIRTSDPNAPRTIDLDIALAGELVLADRKSGIDIPDPEILTRAHVALPLADLAPDAVHPVTGETLSEIAEGFRAEAGIRVYEGPSLPPIGP
jgi:7,8-dihydro-6-hydroxymethylpterin-pyrophosphokinase